LLISLLAPSPSFFEQYLVGFMLLSYIYIYIYIYMYIYIYITFIVHIILLFSNMLITWRFYIFFFSFLWIAAWGSPSSVCHWI
jgi:hypothetical protein